MAIIICPDCNRSVSDLAISCPQCGFPIREKLSSLMSAAITSIPNYTDSQLTPVTSAEKNGDACTSETLLPGQAGSQVKLTNAAPAFSGYEPITASDSPAQPASPTQIVKDKELSQATAAVLAMGGMGHPWFRYLRE